METYRKIETLSPVQAKDWIAGKREGQYIVLDVRQPAEYRAGHLPGAELIPLPELLDRIGELDPSKAVLTYCRSGNRSRSAAALLLTAGFGEVVNLAGGIRAWDDHKAVGDYWDGLYLLEDRETVESLISLLWSLEEGSREFYKKAGEITSDKAAKDLLRRLEEAEEKHKSNVYDAYKMVAGEGAIDFRENETSEDVMEGGVKIEKVLGFLKEKGRTVGDLLEISMEIETNALDLYVKMLRKIGQENARKVFTSVIEEEKHHLSLLGKLLEQRVLQS